MVRNAMMSFICRFAPSPNGRLHLGHAFSAMVNSNAASRVGGRFLVRMEDIDTTRCRPEYEAGILEDLAWLSIVPSEPPRRQSEHFADYGEALARLERLGLVYPAFESRSEIARAVIEKEAALGHSLPRDPDGALITPFARTELSDGERARRRAAGEPFVLRIDMAAAVKAAGDGFFWNEAEDAPEGPPRPVPADPAAWGDVILARKDAPTTYHLSVVVDDALQGITHVIRGQDLYASTAVHVLLQRLLGLPAPTYFHHRLILDVDGRKLSKSQGSRSIAALRAAGASPSDIRAMVDLPPQPTPST